MKRAVTIKGVTIGEGMPKICVPMVGENISELIEEANFLKNIDFDIVEWRADFFEYVTNIDKVKEALQIIREILSDKPILFTFRSSDEGGEKEIDEEFYVELNRSVIITKLVQLIDIELFKEEEDIRELVDAAHANEVAVIISNHDFNRTPAKEEIIYRLRRADELGADIPKIAVMPACTKDLLTLLDATRIVKEKYADGPIITMSMAGKGVVSRLSGELFGSAVTFGAARKVSAPGQISVVELRKILHLIHDNL
jgi:3-dehydroquinate dehydratase I